MKKAVAYARFSSENQRDESIDAQVRAIKYFALNSGYEIIDIYQDKALSGKSDKRPQFLKMIADSNLNKFEAVIVHKLDRFSRDSLDTLFYEKELQKNGVELISVSERLDNTPEGLLMKSIIIGMNQFYSANLAREVMKGLKENAFNCKHTGGLPPLGYDLDINNLYIINIIEAQAVKIIFEMYDNEYGYTSIINKLNSLGYKTKLGNNFGKNSLYDILRNEKYSGVYIYNKTFGKSLKGTFNRHKYKSNEEIIRVEDGMPAIIPKELFMRVQVKMKNNKLKTATHKAKSFYLLSGVLYCGKCGYAMTGATSRYRNKEYFYYICSKSSNNKNCNKKSVDARLVEANVIKYLDEKLFNNIDIEEICTRIYNDYHNNNSNDSKIKLLHSEVKKINIKIENLYKAVEQGKDIEAIMERISNYKLNISTLKINALELEAMNLTNTKTLEELILTYNSISLVDLSDEYKKIVIKRMVDRIYIFEDDDYNKIKLRIILNPFNLNLNDFFDMTGNGLSPPNPKTRITS